ncbi:MAG TPA: hypothetical protein VIV66_20770 [Pyrinomonadaceae bacterium]
MLEGSDEAQRELLAWVDDGANVAYRFWRGGLPPRGDVLSMDLGMKIGDHRGFGVLSQTKEGHILLIASTGEQLRVTGDDRHIIEYCKEPNHYRLQVRHHRWKSMVQLRREAGPNQ